MLKIRAYLFSSYEMPEILRAINESITLSIFASRNGDGRVQTILNIHANVFLQASVSLANWLPVTPHGSNP
jgi:hypothetical protein